MRAFLRAKSPAIGTKLTLGFGVLVFTTLAVVALAIVAGREATNDIAVSEAVRAPAALASAQAQESLLRMQLHLRGYLVLSDPADIEQYQQASAAFESALAQLQQSARLWSAEDEQRVRALGDSYARWKLLPQRLFELHDNPMRNRPALRLSRVEVQAQRVRVMAETEAMIALQRARASSDANREALAAMLAFQNSIDAMSTNVMAFGASGESSFRLNYGPQLVANAALWEALLAWRGSLTPAQRQQLDRIGQARVKLTEVSLQVRAIMEGDRAVEDLYLYRTELVPQTAALLDLLRQITARQQALLQSELAHARRSLDRSRTFTLAGGAVALAFGIAMAYFLRRSIVGPVQRLTDVAGRIAGGDLQAKAPAEAQDEIGRLADSFNVMTTRLAETINRLEAASAEAHHAKDAAEAANRAKSTFLAAMSHELRTPLNAILGYAQLLRQSDGLDTRHAAALDTIRRSGEHLLLLITDLLDLARIEAGKLELYADVTDLSALLRTVCDIVRIEASRKDLRFEFESVGVVPQAVRVDDKRLRQVLLNLLNNAVKFTRQGRVGLRVTALHTGAQQARLRFEVEDTGIGIDAEQLERLFHPFEQARGVQRQFGGAGLGLVISRELLSVMGSAIHVDSRAGAGSRFWFELDLPLASPAPEASASAVEGLVGYEGPRRRILVVDDVDANRALMVQILGRLGFEMQEVADGDAALRCIAQAPPDLVLMDSVMPIMNGAEATRRLRRDERFRRLPVIAVSANASAADREASLASGADAFVPKPVDFTQLLPEIARLLGLAWTTRASPAAAPAAPEPAAVPLPAEELATLLQLARYGNMRSIRERAERLGALDERYRPLAERLCKLAEGYETVAIATLLSTLQAGERRHEPNQPTVAPR